MFGTLWVVATPLGNLGDFSPRARETLERADIILAEDTRRSGLLLQLAGIGPRRLISLHEHNEAERIAGVLEFLSQGLQVAVISDAGTPLIADPGYRLVAVCREKGIPVVPVPGPCAPITALMASGIPPYPFLFLGFLPRKSGEIKALFAQFAYLPTTLVFFERKNRALSSLALAFEILGEREFCLARELTKKHEQFINGWLGQPPIMEEELLGEVTCVIGPPKAQSRMTPEDVQALVESLRSMDLRPKELARRVQECAPGWTVKQIYELILETGKGVE